MNPLAVYLDEHELHTWRDTFKILGVAIALAGLCYLATLIKPFWLERKNQEYEVGETLNSAWQPAQENCTDVFSVSTQFNFSETRHQRT